MPNLVLKENRTNGFQGKKSFEILNNQASVPHAARSGAAMGMSAYYSPMMNSFTIVEGPDPCFYLKTPQSPTWMEKVGNLMSNPICIVLFSSC